jgi:hypothetical protein
MRDENKCVDEDLIASSFDFEVLEENVDSEDLKGLIDDILA